MFTVKCDSGVKASSFKENDKVYINPEKLLPMARFLPPPYVASRIIVVVRWWLVVVPL